MATYRRLIAEIKNAMVIIYISGIDGCGKTTQAQFLVDRLKQNGLSAEYCWLRWEPSIVPLITRVKRLAKYRRSTGSARNDIVSTENIHHGKWSELKKKFFSNSLFRKLWIFYACKDYLRSYRKNRLKWRCSYVILDRYFLDFAIDQSLNLSIPPNEFQELLAETALAEMKVPDLSVFIDLPADVGYKRKLDGTPLHYLQEREQLYRNITVSGPVLHVDGTQSAEDVHDEITRWVFLNIGGNDEH